MVTRAIIDEQPYPVRVAYVQSSNPLVTWLNAKETYEALNRLHFLAVAERFMTPTASQLQEPYLHEPKGLCRPSWWTLYR